MPLGITNWVKDSNLPSEKDYRTLKKAKLQERKKEKDGFRWIAISGRTRLLVECDEHGQPTKKGQEMINRYKANT